MNKPWFVPILCFVLVFLFVGCSSNIDTTNSPARSTQSTQSVSEIEKTEMELVWEATAWQMEGESFYLVFTKDKHVTACDFTQLDGETENVGKFSSYDIGTAENGMQSITVYHLTQEEQTVFDYQKDSKSFVVTNTKKALQPVSMRTFVQAFIARIQEVQKQGEETWSSQGEINQGIGTLCYYWDALYQMVNTHLETVLSAEQYQDLMEENKAFITNRDIAMQEAGKEFEGGSSYQMITGSVYCTQTQNRIESLMNQYLK